MSSVQEWSSWSSVQEWFQLELCTQAVPARALHLLELGRYIQWTRGPRPGDPGTQGPGPELAYIVCVHKYSA